jgi:hypothetical protein
MRCASFVMALAAILGPTTPALAGQVEHDLLTAREAYNAREYDRAIEAAERARESSQWADRADLVAARAYLERYRATAAAEDLSSARERLRRLDPDRFTLRERVEFVVGLGAALFFDDSPGAAATLFASALDSLDGLDPLARERVIDWWASALDRDARARPREERRAIYDRVTARMRSELADQPGSAAAAYWLVAAAAGSEAWDAAWDAALAAWVRASLAADHGAALRADIDRLVQRAVIPSRAAHVSMAPDLLVQEWELFKQRWTK